MRIILATTNEHKFDEIRQILPDGIDLVNQSSLNIPSAAETGLTFVENALIKARHASAACNLPAIADDSGLEVDALNGRPGIYSSRYAGVNATDSENIVKLLAEMRRERLRTARFQCVMVFLRYAGDATPVIAEGTWDGEITSQAKGQAGFGYDPVFYLPDQCKTVAELPAEVKNKLSHRAQALRQLGDRFQ